MNVATAIMYVKDVAKRAYNHRKGDYGVSIQYVLAEIKRYQESEGVKGLKADLKPVPVGNPYYIITEEDFLAWEEKRGRSPGDEP
jgi:hypothetical protein